MIVARMRHLLAGLSARERLLAGTALAIGATVLLYIGVVEPLSAARRESAVRLADRVELLEWIAARAGEARALRASLGDHGTGPPTTGTAGIAEIEASFDAHGLRSALTRLTPQPGGRFEARFEDVSYTALIGWLGESGRRSGVAVTSIVIEATGRPDRVNAELSAVMEQGEPP